MKIILLIGLILIFILINLYFDEKFLINTDLSESCKNKNDDCMKKNFINDLKPDIKNDFKYNLNDLLFGYGDSVKFNLIKSNCKNIEKYKNTLLCLYFNKYKKRDSNITNNLFKFFKVNKLLKKDLNNVLVIHLRLGDAFSHKWALKNKWNNISIEKYKKLILPKHINEVHIFSGSHKKLSDKDLNKSINHIKKVQEYFENKNLKVKLFLGGDVDKSFIHMCSAKYFVKSNGGFSQTISNIVKKNNGVVYN